MRPTGQVPTDEREPPASVPVGTALVEIGDLTVRSASGLILDRVSATVSAGRTLGIVGESGSGKSMTALSVLGLLPRGVHAVSGSIRVEGTEMFGADDKGFDAVRGKRAAMVFQDPLAALDPVLRVGAQATEILRRRDGLKRAAARAVAVELFRRVGLPDPDSLVQAYPHQLSGGQRQRVVIAMALAGRPSVLLADEPTTALDVTVQANILRLLRGLQEADGLGVMLISHDLRVMAHFSDELIVMRRGVVVETGPTHEVLARPQHDYTAALLSHVPAVGARGRFA